MECKILMVGPTGHGKSTLATQLAKRFTLPGFVSPFEESPSASAYTQEMVYWSAEGVKIGDGPGLLDTEGVSKDEQNISKIVNSVRREGYINLFVLVINSQDNRLNSGIQDAILLLHDSFGPQFLRQMAIVFTRSYYGARTKESLQAQIDEFIVIIGKKCGATGLDLRAWHVDLHPEKTAAMGVPAETIQASTEAMHHVLSEVIQLARPSPPLDTSDAFPGEYEQRRAARLARERAAEEERMRKEADERSRNEVELRAKEERMRIEADLRAAEQWRRCMEAESRADREQYYRREAERNAERKAIEERHRRELEKKDAELREARTERENARRRRELEEESRTGCIVS